LLREYLLTTSPLAKPLSLKRRGRSRYGSIVLSCRRSRPIGSGFERRSRVAARFVELFTDEDFTVFSDGVHDIESANARFDGMLSLAELVPYAKQPVIARATDTIIGYTGVGIVLIDGVDRLEWGWRLAPEARGLGYATRGDRSLARPCRCPRQRARCCASSRSTTLHPSAWRTRWVSAGGGGSTGWAIHPSGLTCWSGVLAPEANISSRSTVPEARLRTQQRAPDRRLGSVVELSLP